MAKAKPHNWRKFNEWRFNPEFDAIEEAKKLKVPQPSDFGGDMEKYLDALNKHMKEVEKLAKKK
tara:strand:- start:38 stop:229 length:192 start_codon:yes stop_codon:yes gene_type:complete